MQVLMTILYILLFILCLSVLVMIHELGHFSAAKFFKVYIKEFSIGFGPKLIQKKRKNGETTFSLRAIPFGGYVAMYEKGLEVDPELNIPESRSFDGIAKWKRIIILFAGVFNNAILALVLFLISESCFINKQMYLSYVNVEKDSIAEKAGIKDEDYISVRQYSYLNGNGDKVLLANAYTIDSNATITYSDDSSAPIYAILSAEKATYTDRTYDSALHFYTKNDDGYANLGNEIVASSSIKSISYTVTTAKSVYKQYKNNEWVDMPYEPIINPVTGEAYVDKEVNKSLMKWDGTNWVKTSANQIGYEIPTGIDQYFIWCDLEGVKTAHEIVETVQIDEAGKRAFISSGLSFYYEEYWNSFGQAVKNTFDDFGYSATIIVRSLGSLFTSTENWKNVGGIVAIGVQTTNILQNFGFGKFIYVWGLISVNLAIVNLLPFPGLDGWQILVLAVEVIFHKEIPEKVKTIVSYIGLAILFAFMIIIIVKDVIGLF